MAGTNLQAALKELTRLFPDPDGEFHRILQAEIITPTSGLPASPHYVLTSDGTNITAYDGFGVQVKTGTDWGAVVASLLPANGARGITIACRNDGHVFPQSTVPQLPSGINGRLRLEGYDSTIQFQNAANPRFLDLGKVADYDTFQNIRVRDFVVDNNNLGGKHHVICGTYINGVQTTRVNLANLLFDNIRTINVPVDSTLTNHRLNLWFVVDMPVGSSACSITNVVFRGCRAEGGNAGFEVGASDTAAASLTVDHIRFEGLYHSLLSVQNTNFSSNNFQIGSRATVGSDITIRDCYGEYSGDVGVEIDNAQHAYIENVTIVDANSNAFYWTNFVAPTNVNEQVIHFRDCKARKLTCTGNGYSFGQAVQAGIVMGQMWIDGCEGYCSEPTTTTWRGVSAGTVGGVGPTAVKIRGCKFTREGWTNGSNSQSLRLIVVSAAGGGTIRTVITDNELYDSGTVTGAPTGWNISGLFVDAGTQDVTIERNKINIVTANSPSSICVPINLGFTTAITLKGSIRRNVLANTGDAGPDMILVNSNVTISPYLTIEGNDFTGCAAAGFANTVVVVTAATKQKIKLKGNFYRTPPAPVTLVLGGSGTATAVQTMWSCYATFTQGSGTGVTTIDVSTDGGSHFTNFLTQTSAALPAGFDQSVGPLASDAQIKSSYTTAPTVTLVPYDP